MDRKTGLNKCGDAESSMVTVSDGGADIKLPTPELESGIDHNDTVGGTKRSNWSKRLERGYKHIGLAVTRKKRSLARMAMSVLVCLWLVYLAIAITKRQEKAIPIVVLSLFVLLVIGWRKLKRWLRANIFSKTSGRVNSVCRGKGKLWAKRCVWCAVGIAFIVFVVMDTSRHKENLTSLGGLLLFIFLVFISSTDPFKVKWTPVLWGLAIQFILGLIILKWDKGYQAFSFIGDQVKTFLEYADAGSKFVFGEKTYLLHPFAFKVLPVVVFFSSVISILYYWGVIQSVIETLACLLQYTMATTPVESLAGAAHIFVGQVESSVMLKPFLERLTHSELHAVFTTGFATISGAVVAAFIEIGAPPEHLLAASFMSGPAALALSKLGYPETEHSVTKSEEDVKLPKGQQRNVIEAASEGAITVIKLVAYIVVNIIAFLSILDFINAVLNYLGTNVGIENLTFQLICSYVFRPLAAVMGVPWEDTGKVGTLIGTKIFINEFVGYAQMGHMVKTGQIQKRTEVISTYILCGFGSITGMGICLGVFSAVAPSRRRDVAGHMAHALVLGNIACFTTACIAGMLYTDSPDMQTYVGNVTSMYNSTLP